MKVLHSHLTNLIRKYSDDEMSIYAAQAAYFTILAAFPFFMLLLSLINFIPVVHESDLLDVVVHILPDNLDALAITVITDIQNTTSVTLLSASALTAIWSASKGMLGIERGLNRAYGVDVQRHYFVRRLVCSGYTMLFTALCAFSLMLMNIASFFMMGVFILAFYALLPYRPQSLLKQIPGTIFTAIGWSLFTWAFSFYFRFFKHFIPTYGSLTAIILMMLWLYFCICILFFGAEINSYFDTRT